MNGTSVDANLTSALGYSAVGDNQHTSPDLSGPYPLTTSASTDSHDAPISVTSLRPTALDKIQNFLLRGERRQAYHYALDERLWAHAMIIASSIDKDAWKEVVNEFLRSELGVKNDSSRAPSYKRGNDSSVPIVNGREGLRVAYSLYSGQGAAAGE